MSSEQNNDNKNNDKSTNNNNNNESGASATAAAAGGPPTTIVLDQSKRNAERARRQWDAEQDLAQFAKLYFAGATEEQLCQALKMHRSTYYRYIQKLAVQQEELLKENILSATLVQVASVRNTFRLTEFYMRKILENKDALPSDKVDAANLMCGVSWAHLKLLTSGPIQTLQALPADIKKRLITEEQGLSELIVDNSDFGSTIKNERLEEDKDRKEGDSNAEGKGSE